MPLNLGLVGAGAAGLIPLPTLVDGIAGVLLLYGLLDVDDGICAIATGIERTGPVLCTREHARRLGTLKIVVGGITMLLGVIGLFL